MTKAPRRVRRWLAVKGRRWSHPLLARSLARLGDDEIDSALDYAGLSRNKLFRARDAIAQHRTRMANMLVAQGIDVDDAVASHWAEMKHADGECSRCAQVGRCRRWLDWGRDNNAPRVFCPNYAVFRSIAADQARRQLGRYLT